MIPVCARCGEVMTDMLAHFDCPVVPCCPHRGPASHFTDDGWQTEGAKCNTTGCQCAGWDGNP